MPKNQCIEHLERAAEVLGEMIEMMNGDDSLQAFVEAYEDVSHQLARSVSIAVAAAIPESPRFIDDDTDPESMEIPALVTLRRD